MKTKTKTEPATEVFDLPKLKLEVALEAAAKALDYPAHRFNTPSRKPEAQLPVDALCLLHDKAQKSIALTAALKSAHDLLAKCGGTALGIAMSGKRHPNPDEKLEELFRLCNAETEKIVELLR